MSEEVENDAPRELPAEVSAGTLSGGSSVELVAPSRHEERATGYGLSTTRVGDVTTAHIVVRDERRKRFCDVPDPDSMNGSALHATLTGPTPTAVIHPSIAPTRGDPGLYTLRYRPMEEGPHALRIFLHGKEVDGSPLRWGPVGRPVPNARG